VVHLLRSIHRSVTVDADPRDDQAFDAILAIAPYTIGGTGISDRNRIIWSGNDTGTSLAVRLTAEEEAVVRRSIAEYGGDPHRLIPLHQ
jgi:hypothetical protein